MIMIWLSKRGGCILALVRLYEVWFEIIQFLILITRSMSKKLIVNIHKIIPMSFIWFARTTLPQITRTISSIPTIPTPFISHKHRTSAVLNPEIWYSRAVHVVPQECRTTFRTHARAHPREHGSPTWSRGWGRWVRRVDIFVLQGED